MKPLIVLAALLAVAAVAFGSPRTTSAAGGVLPADWPPLLNCPDVNGSGSVDVGDVFQIVDRFGTTVVKDSDGFFVPGDGYMLLYDLNGGGAVEIGDILQPLLDFGTTCPLVETQVAQATLATMPYRDWNAASAAGYSAQTQYVSDMGIHVSNSQYATTFDHESPIGLIYKADDQGNPDQLIGLWYVVPVPEVCAVFLPGQSCSDAEPEGFDGPEDNTDISSVQRGWHTHTNLCFVPDGPFVIEFGSVSNADQLCADAGGIINFETYGWMAHLYNFIPNPDGRFMMWNYDNLP